MPTLPSEPLAILENLDDRYVILNGDCEPIWLNFSARKFEEISLEESNANEYFRGLGQKLKELRESPGQATKRTCKYEAKDQERYIEWQIQSTEGSIANGELLLIGRDVTDFQYELLDTKSKLKHLATIIDSEPSCVKTIGKEGELIDMNPAGLHLIDAPDLESVKGVSVYELMEGESLERFKEFNRQVFEGKSGSLDFEITSLKGQRRHMRTYASPLKDENGNVILHVAVTNEVTEEIQKTQQLRESMEKAQTAAIAKGQFLANMSHEIRTPMNGVVGMAELLEESPLDDEQQLYARTIRSSGEALLSIINDILDFSKIQAGKLEVYPRPSSLRVEIASLRQIFKNQAESKGLELCLEVSPKVPNSVVVDPDRFKQIVINLLGNAIKFTDKGRVGANIDYSDPESTDPEHLIVEVFDTGIGISEENKDRIFESFTQGNAGFNRDYGGTGLGLSISNQLIELMGGELKMKSEFGKGTTFRFTIPVDDPQDSMEPLIEQPPTENKPKEGRKPLSILLAEDNPLNQTYALRILEKAGHRVAVAENGAEAISAFCAESFDLVLMDIQMPVVDGEQATQEIREIDKSQKVPIVAVTANAMKEAKKRYLEIGMNSVLSKPFTKEELLELIDSLAGEPVQPGLS